jgi:hypothetical protein
LQEGAVQIACEATPGFSTGAPTAVERNIGGSITSLVTKATRQAVDHATRNRERGQEPKLSVGATLGVAAAILLASCGPANTDRSHVVDGLRFDYRVAAAAPDPPFNYHRYRIDLSVFDAKTGARIPDAAVTVSVFGPQHPPGGSGFAMKPAPVEGGAGYSRALEFPTAATYRLTFSATLPGGHHKPVNAAFAFRSPV